jgi:ADP-heptose:LPS heptosyltransferase
MSVFFRKYRNPQKPSLDNISKILIISHDPIGDLVITSPLWSFLRTRKPGIKIGIACSQRNADVLRKEPVDITYDLYTGNLLSIWSRMRQARRDGWDVVLVTAGFYKPARFAFVSRFIARKGITATMHSARAQRYARIYSFCFKRPPEWECVPMAEQYQSLVENVFEIPFTKQERLPHFTIDDPTRIEIEKKLDTILTEKKCSRYIHINLEAKVPYREWGIENTVALTKALAEAKIDVVVLVTASAEYRAYCRLEESIAEISNLIVFETNDLHELAAVIQRAALVISPDTAVVHIAAALQKKIIAFYPSSDEWLLYGVEAEIFYPKRWEPISSINVNTVFSAVVSSLNS